MAVCPICGKESTGKEITVDGKKVVNLCNTCHSFIICLIKPVSYYSKTNAQNWAEDKIKNHANTYIKEFLTLCYNYSLSESAEPDLSDSASANTAKAPSVSFTPSEQRIVEPPASAKVSISKTRTVKTLCYLSIILAGIIGGISGAAIDETAMFFGTVIGLAAGALLSAFTMMFVEMSENIAINAKASLRTEKLLEEIRQELKNSEK